MLPTDISTTAAKRHLWRADNDPSGLDRRRFLAMVGAGAAVGTLGGINGLVSSLLPGHDPAAWAAGPLAPDQGVLVLLCLDGGNDALNTVVPFGDGNYHSYRNGLSLTQEQTLPLDDQTGLHPALTYVHQRWNAGDVAILEGVGYPNPNLSHFASMDIWMSGSPTGAAQTGWIGRWLDDYLGGASDLYAAAEVGYSIPLLLVGQHASGTGVPPVKPIVGVPREWRVDLDNKMYAAIAAQAVAPPPTPAGRAAQATLDQLAVAATVNGVFPQSLSTAPLTAKLEIVANLISADLGFRVLTVNADGDFDTHASQTSAHDSRMAELDAGLQHFFTTLPPEWHDRVTVATFSEFGRTPHANDGGGTDHGTAGTQFVIGNRVVGGLYGHRPNLAGLGRWDRIAFTPDSVDYRSYWATLLEWLGGDPQAVFGIPTENLGLVLPVGVDPPPPTTTTTTTVAPTTTTTVAPTTTTTVAPTTTTSAPSSPTSTSVPLAPTTTVPVTSPPVTTMPPPQPITPIGFTAVNPARLLDTRVGLGGPARPLGADESVTLQVAGRGGIPSTGVSAVVVNVTSILPTDATFLTLYATGTLAPPTSAVNPEPGRVVPNVAVVAVDSTGRLDVRNRFGSVDCAVDVAGYFSAGGTGFRAVQPMRVLDTRTGLSAGGRLGPGTSIDVVVAGRAGVPAGARAVVLNVAAVDPGRTGYLTVWPTGSVRNTVSNLNCETGRTAAGLVVCGVGQGGSVSLFSLGDTDAIADVVGYLGEGGDVLTAIKPARLLDTRAGAGAPRRPLGGGEAIRLQVTGRAGIPQAATAIVCNVTAVGATQATFVSTSPNGQNLRSTSTVNTASPGAVANSAWAGLGDDGALTVFNAFGMLDVIVDVTGYFAPVG